MGYSPWGLKELDTVKGIIISLFNLPENFMLQLTLAEKYTSYQEGLSQTKYGHKQDDWPGITGSSPITHKTQDCEPHGRAVLLGPLTCLLSTQAPLPSKGFCFVSKCVSLGNSFPTVRQEPTLGPWKECPFLQQTCL